MVTGGVGFVRSHLVEAYFNEGAKKVIMIIFKQWTMEKLGSYDK